MAQSTAEEKYVTANVVVNLAIWLRHMLADLHMEYNEPTQIFVDSQAAIFNLKIMFCVTGLSGCLFPGSQA